MGVVRITISSVACFLGYSSFMTFLILKNFPAAVLGFISGSTDAILILLHYLEYKKKLTIWYDRNDLRKFCHVGIMVGSIGILCIGYFTTVQIMLKKPMMPIPESGTIPIVWSIVVLRSGILLLYYSIKYQKGDEEDVRAIVVANEENTEAITSTSEEA